MHEFLACALATHRPRLLQRWEESLRALPPSSALAHPDALVHLMPSTLDRIRAALATIPDVHPARTASDCPCGMNPLVTFFITAETALIDTLFSAEPAWAKLTSAQREAGLNVVRATVHAIADDDIEAFCSLCLRRTAMRRNVRLSPKQLVGVSAPAWDGSAHDKRWEPRP